MSNPFHGIKSASVALLAEGVDRNVKGSSRWTGRPVALLAEGVDRNFTKMLSTLS